MTQEETNHLRDEILRLAATAPNWADCANFSPTKPGQRTRRQSGPVPHEADTRSHRHGHLLPAGQIDHGQRLHADAPPSPEETARALDTNQARVLGQYPVL